MVPCCVCVCRRESEFVSTQLCSFVLDGVPLAFDRSGKGDELIPSLELLWMIRACARVCVTKTVMLHGAVAAFRAVCERTRTAVDCNARSSADVLGTRG